MEEETIPETPVAHETAQPSDAELSSEQQVAQLHAIWQHYPLEVVKQLEEVLLVYGIEGAQVVTEMLQEWEDT